MRLLIRLTLALAIAAMIGFGPRLSFAADEDTAKKAVTEKPKAKPAAKKPGTQKSATPAKKATSPKKKPMPAEKAEAKRNPNAPVNATKIVRPGRVAPPPLPAE